MRGDGRAVVLTTHDVAMAERYAGRIVRLDYGKIVGDVAATGGADR